MHCTGTIFISLSGLTGQRICDHVLSWPAFAAATNIGVYVHCAKLREVDTSRLLAAGLSSGVWSFRRCAQFRPLDGCMPHTFGGRHRTAYANFGVRQESDVTFLLLRTRAPTCGCYTWVRLLCIQPVPFYSIIYGSPAFAGDRGLLLHG